MAGRRASMRKRDRKALNVYCRDLADKIELRDWTICVAVAVPDSPERTDGKTWGASSDSLPGRKVVNLTFDPACRGWSLEDLRATVAHELIHAHFAQLTEMARNDLDGHLVDSAYDLFNKSFTRWLEYGVDAMADATAKNLPLIDWPK